MDSSFQATKQIIQPIKDLGSIRAIFLSMDSQDSVTMRHLYVFRKLKQSYILIILKKVANFQASLIPRASQTQHNFTDCFQAPCCVVKDLLIPQLYL